MLVRYATAHSAAARSAPCAGSSARRGADVPERGSGRATRTARTPYHAPGVIVSISFPYRVYYREGHFCSINTRNALIYATSSRAPRTTRPPHRDGPTCVVRVRRGSCRARGGGAAERALRASRRARAPASRATRTAAIAETSSATNNGCTDHVRSTGRDAAGFLPTSSPWAGRGSRFSKRVRAVASIGRPLQEDPARPAGQRCLGRW